MPDITKIPRSKIATFIDTTPTANSETYTLLGVGITEYAISYNPQTTTEKWIIHDNATTTHDGNQKQGAVSQKAYKGDGVFEYVAGLRDKFGSDVKTTALDVDIWDATGTTTVSYSAKKSNITVIITSYGGSDAVIEYTLYYDGDPIEGSVTITSGVPTFTPSVT